MWKRLRLHLFLKIDLRDRERPRFCCSTYLCIHWLILACALTGDWTHSLRLLRRCSWPGTEAPSLFWKYTHTHTHTMNKCMPLKVTKNRMLPWLVLLSGLSAFLQTYGSPVWLSFRAHAWVVGQVPSRGHARGNHTLTFFSLFLLSFPSKNK